MPEIRPDQTEKPTFRRSDLKDHAFYQAHEREIIEAVRDGRVVDDVTPTKQNVVGKPWGTPGQKWDGEKFVPDLDRIPGE